MELLIEHLGHGLMLSLILSLPVVLTAAGIGLVVGILQAVTQVQEQTIAAAPKILGVFAVLLLGGGLMMTMLENYVRESCQIAFNEIPLDGKFILPPRATQTAGQNRARAFFDLQAKEGSRSDKLKEYADQWKIPESKENTSTIKVNSRPVAGSALGLSEKMSLNKKH